MIDVIHKYQEELRIFSAHLKWMAYRTFRQFLNGPSAMNVELNLVDNIKREAAKILSLARKTLHNKLDKYDNEAYVWECFDSWIKRVQCLDDCDQIASEVDPKKLT